MASKVYQDEPILITQADADKELYTPPKYLAMRKIARRSGALYESDAKIFYEQGKFMEDFEDDFLYRGDFMRYFPTYQSMSGSQLRGYFSWRAEVRRGVIKRTPLSFVFVYIYELINQIGARTPEEGFHILKNFWTAYREIEPKIDRYVKLWLKDYVVYNNLDKSLLEDFIGADADINKLVMTLFNHKNHSAGEVFSALNSLSFYDFESSKFFKAYPDDVRSVVYEVFAAVPDRCGKLLGEVYASSYSMFKTAVFYDRLRQRNFVYEVDDLSKYACKNGNWSYERFFCYRGKNRQIGALLKAIDFMMRQKYNFKSALKIGETAKIKIPLGVIAEAIDACLERRREAARPKVEIDLSKLQNIREAAIETQDKLLVEELEEPGGHEIFSEKDLPRTPENDTGLSDVEYLFLKRLLYGQDYGGLIKQKSLPLSVLVDAVNEKLFDRFGDTVIVDINGKPELRADYEEELKSVIR